jgi:hypothetical protein
MGMICLALVFLALFLYACGGIIMSILLFVGYIISFYKSKQKRPLPQVIDTQLNQKQEVVDTRLNQKQVFLVVDKGVFGVPFNATVDEVFGWCKENNFIIYGSKYILKGLESKLPLGVIVNLSDNNGLDAKEIGEFHKRMVCVLRPNNQSFNFFIDNHLDKIEILFLEDNETIRSFSSHANFRTSEQFDLISETLTKKYGNPSIFDMNSDDSQIVLAREYLSRYIYNNVGISSHAGCTLISWGNSIVIYASPKDLKFIDGILKFTGDSFSVLYFHYPLTEKIKQIIESTKQRRLRESVEREKRKKETAIDNF